MRIPLKEQTQLNGYRPALNPSSKDKLIWYKNKTHGIIYRILCRIPFFIVPAGAFWGYNAEEEALNSPRVFLGMDDIISRNKLILLFVIAAVFGILGYIWGLFVYDHLEVKTVPSDESIELYQKTPKYTEEKQTRMKQWWWAIPAAIAMTSVVVYMLFDYSIDGFRYGGALAIILYLTSLLVYLALYKLTVYISREYIDKKFDIES